MKLELLTNATVVDDAIRFVSDRSKQTPSSSSDNINEKGDPKEPDYDEYQLEGARRGNWLNSDYHKSSFLI